ncbi:hypothetical protein HF1_10390 [Mycoplasma haemofelis str. Langford 1]|uniref:Uncharacterized protein n=1 Tax=Mycoplasma haemofelis (strain Langford 1) TaxID=941640 RepID=E8ZIS6_MYCHL|nr:hypothetical protein [Mycoplasma haemofelis]CBY93047.1 hypothetical protein HF1_10390 [Mycoplasma haemofelis str. Langford 1]
MRALPYLVFLGLGTAGLGGWYKFQHLKPKTLQEYLEWQGFKLLSHFEENHWKAVLEENKDLLSKLGISTSHSGGVKSWCERNLNSESYEELVDVAPLLCVDNIRTVKGRIIQIAGDTSKLIQAGDQEANQYKVAYVFRKHIDGFHALIGYSPEVDEGKEVEDLDKAHQAFKAWCNDSLDKPINEALAQNVMALCTPKGFSTIEELIKRNGETLLTESSRSQELKEKYEKIKELDSWKNENQNSKSNEEDLKSWCDENKAKNFYDENVFSEVYPKFRFRCLKLEE